MKSLLDDEDRCRGAIDEADVPEEVQAESTELVPSLHVIGRSSFMPSPSTRRREAYVLHSLEHLFIFSHVVRLPSSRTRPCVRRTSWFSRLLSLVVQELGRSTPRRALGNPY
jgi:hypothetical protein